MSLTLINQLLATATEYKIISIALLSFAFGIITGMVMYPTKRIVADLATWYTTFSKTLRILNHLNIDDYHFIRSEILLLVMNLLACRYSDKSFVLSKNYLKSKGYRKQDVDEIIAYVNKSVTSFIEPYTFIGLLKRIKRSILDLIKEPS